MVLVMSWSLLKTGLSNSTTRHRNGHLHRSSDTSSSASDDDDGGSTKEVGRMALLKAVEASQETRMACSLIFEGIAAVVSPLMAIELEPAFNKPFVAHSLTDFWGKRLNLLVSNLLRASIYDPVLRILLWSRLNVNHKRKSTLGLQEQSQETMSAPPNYVYNNLPLWPRSVATFACFLASGLMHELIFYNMTGSKPTWEVTFFFILNGAATVLEGALRQKTRLRLPKLVSIPLTLSFILVTAIWYFYPPLVDSGTVDDSVAEFTYFFTEFARTGGKIVTQ